MAQFIGFIRGGRGEASRLGHKTTGLTAEARGWTTGAEIRIAHVDGRDVVHVYRTEGSGGAGRRVLVASWEAGAEFATYRYLTGRDHTCGENWCPDCHCCQLCAPPCKNQPHGRTK